MQGDNNNDNNNTPANAANARRCKVPVIVMPGAAALAYKADDVLAKGVVYRGKHVAVKMIRGALKGAMSRLGKKRRLTANRAARKGIEVEVE